MLKNFKEAVRTKDEIVLMNCSIDITRSQMEVALGKDDYDAVYFDGQHRPISEEAIVTFCAHAESFGMPVQMRLPHTRQVYLAGRFCDFGLSSIMVPEVMEEATVIEAPSLPSMSVNGTQARAVKLFGPSKVSIPAAFPNAAAGLAAAAFIFLGRKPET